MPYRSNRELPSAVKDALPVAAQTVWRTIFNAAAAEYDDETKAFATAWAGLKQAGWREGRDGGKWYKVEKEAQGVEMRYLKKSAPTRYTLGVVYEPDTLDADEEFARAPLIQKACWAFNRKLHTPFPLAKYVQPLLKALAVLKDSPDGIMLDATDLFAELDVLVPIQKGRVGDQHCDWDDANGEIIESYITPCEMLIDAEEVREGTWLMGMIWSPMMFAKIERGERTGLSMGGFGTSVLWEIQHAA